MSRLALATGQTFYENRGRGIQMGIFGRQSPVYFVGPRGSDRRLPPFLVGSVCRIVVEYGFGLDRCKVGRICDPRPVNFKSVGLH